MRLKQILAACLAASAMLSLAGCRLAREDARESNGEDRLIGVFITREHLDLFDSEAYVNDHVRGMSPGGELIVDQGDAGKYQGRLYASLVSETALNKDTGEEYEDWKYVFKDVEGYSFFSAVTTRPGTGGQYTSAASEGAVSLLEGNHLIGDKEGFTLKGNLYLTTEEQGGTLFFNPVYQQEDETVYAVNGIGIGLPEFYSQEAATIQSNDQTFSFVSDGETKTYTAEVTVNVYMIYPPEKIVVLKMDRSSEVLDRTEYIPGQLPEEITLEAGVAFIIAETHKSDDKGQSLVERKLYEKGADFMETLFLREDKVCVIQSTRLDWS